MWLEFIVAGSGGGGISERYSRRRTVPLVDNFPLMAWMSRLVPDSGDVNSAPSPIPAQTFCAVVRVSTKDIKAQVCVV